MADYKSSEGKLIGGKRYCGKTNRLIKRASEEQLYILCVNKDMARMIYQQAQDMGLRIPFPITTEDLPLEGYMKEVLVDEVEMVLSRLVGKRVVGMSSSMKFEELESLKPSKQIYPNLHRPNGLDCSTDEDYSVETIFDINGTIKGLKAIQREGRKAVSVLKELETIQNNITPIAVFEGKAKCPKCKNNNLIIEQQLAGGSGVVAQRKECKDCGWSNVQDDSAENLSTN